MDKRCPDCGVTHWSEYGQRPATCPPTALVEKARAYIAATEADSAMSRDPRDVGGFLFAKTMADNPHWYAVRQQAQARRRGSGHEALFALIRDHHYLRRWHGRAFRTIGLDGFQFWIIEDGTVINRKPAEAAGWDDDEAATLF